MRAGSTYPKGHPRRRGDADRAAARLPGPLALEARIEAVRGLSTCRA
jgi:hypothetical protein